MRPYNLLCNLVVYRDYIESTGEWRLFWEDINNPGFGFDDESTLFGKPFFKTMKSAVNYAIRKYGETPIKRVF